MSGTNISNPFSLRISLITDMSEDDSYVDSLQENIYITAITDEEIIEVVKKLQYKKSCSGTLGELQESWARAIIVPIHIQ